MSETTLVKEQLEELVRKNKTKQRKSRPQEDWGWKVRVEPEKNYHVIVVSFFKKGSDQPISEVPIHVSLAAINVINNVGAELGLSNYELNHETDMSTSGSISFIARKKV